MKTKSYLAVLSLSLLLAGSGVAAADTLKGTIDTVNPNSISLTDKKGKSYSVSVAPDVKLNGINSVTELQAGEHVKIDAKEDNGVYQAKSIKVDKDKDHHKDKGRDHYKNQDKDHSNKNY